MGNHHHYVQELRTGFFLFIRLIIYLQVGYDKLQLKGMQIIHTHTHTYATIKFQMDLLKLSASLLELFDGNKVDHSCCCSCLLLPRVSTCAWIILILPGGALISMKEGR